MALTEDTPPNDDRPSLLGAPVLVTLLVVAVTAVLGWLTHSTDADDPLHRPYYVAFLLAQVALVSIVIWQACDPFADAAQWIGTELRIPGSVRGATLDAVASSMPELFTGVFFVLITRTAVGGEVTVEPGEGYGAAIATCAGSAVYNMILIPAICALFISFYRPSRPTIDVEPEVLARDGVWFLGTSVLLIAFLFQDAMTWWMAIVLLVVYVVYIVHLYVDARTYRIALAAVHAHFGEKGDHHTDEEIIGILRADGIRVAPYIVAKVRFTLEEEEEADDTASVLFGFLSVPLNMISAWLVIAGSTVVAASACYWLVQVTEETATQLGAPLFFVAVILAAAASSVPDTFLSIGAAKRGDDSGAVSNAFGSNIFDICICLAVPLLLSSALVGWEPVSLLVDGRPMSGLVDLRILLAVLTVVTLGIMWHNRQLTRTKALVLCALYGLFIAYAVAGSMGFSLFSGNA